MKALPVTNQFLFGNERFFGTPKVVLSYESGR